MGRRSSISRKHHCREVLDCFASSCTWICLHNAHISAQALISPEIFKVKMVTLEEKEDHDVPVDRSHSPNYEYKHDVDCLLGSPQSACNPARQSNARLSPRPRRRPPPARRLSSHQRSAKLAPLRVPPSVVSSAMPQSLQRTSQPTRQTSWRASRGLCMLMVIST